MSNIQINLRAPVTAKDLVQDVCTRLRSDRQFEERLRTFLANEGAQQDPDLREKVDQLERRLFHFENALNLTRAGRLQLEGDFRRGQSDHQIAGKRSVPVEIVRNVRQLWEHTNRQDPSEPTETATQRLETGDRRDLLETADSAPADAPDEPVPGPWKNGARLTANGRAEIDRRIAAGERDKDIAKALDVTRQAVNARRKKKGG